MISAGTFLGSNTLAVHEHRSLGAVAPLYTELRVSCLRCLAAAGCDGRHAGLVLLLVATVHC